MEMRCYGPKLIKDTPWPPKEQPNIGFPKILESAVLGLIDQETNKPITDPDPIGLNLAAEKMFPVFNRYSVNSYQVRLDWLSIVVIISLTRVCSLLILYIPNRMARQQDWLLTSSSSETSQCLGRT